MRGNRGTCSGVQHLVSHRSARRELSERRLHVVTKVDHKASRVVSRNETSSGHSGVLPGKSFAQKKMARPTGVVVSGIRNRMVPLQAQIGAPRALWPTIRRQMVKVL